MSGGQIHLEFYIWELIRRDQHKAVGEAGYGKRLCSLCSFAKTISCGIVRGAELGPPDSGHPLA